MLRHAETLHDILRVLFPRSAVHVSQAWTKSEVFSRILRSDGPVRQVHVLAHGDTRHLSLAHGFGGRTRLLERARRFNRMVTSDFDRAVASVRDEDAIVQGYLTFGLSSGERAALRARHLPDAQWQLWGIEQATDSNDSSHAAGDPELRHYMGRFAAVQGDGTSLGQEIAIALRVFATTSPISTAAMLPAAASTVQGGRRPPVPPAWTTHAPRTGARSSTTLVCGLPYAPDDPDIARRQLPAALGDLYLHGRGRGAAVPRFAR
jgi:hypothetical protein